MPTTVSANDGQLLGKLQNARGEKATLEDTHELPWGEFNWELDPEFRERNIISPHGPGFKKAVGRIEVGWDAVADCQMKPIVTADDADAPSWDLPLQVSGWDRFSDLGGKHHTYFLNRKLARYATLAGRDDLKNVDDFNEIELVDCIADFDMSLEAGESFILNLNGKAAMQNIDDLLKQGGEALTSGTVFQCEPVLRFESITMRIFDPTNGKLYGGGTLAEPGCDVELISLDLSSNRNITAQKGACGAFGVARQAPNVETPPSGTLLMEATGYNDFNPYAMMAKEQPLYVGVDAFMPGSQTLLVRIGFYAQITGSPSRSKDDGRITWGLPIDLIYPAPASAAPVSTDAGCKPSQAWEPGPNAPNDIGLYTIAGLVPPPGALAFIQFVEIVPAA